MFRHFAAVLTIAIVSAALLIHLPQQDNAAAEPHDHASADLCTLDLGHTTTQSASPTAMSDEPMFMHDRMMTTILHNAGAELIEQDKVTPMAELIDQLNTASVKVELPAAHEQALSGAEVYDNCSKGTLIVGSMFKCDKCTNWHCSPASGFIISTSGLAVTNYHVINDNKNHTLVAMTVDRKVYAVKQVVAASATDDLAIVQLDGDNFTPIPLRANAPVGSDAYVISNPSGRFFNFTKGMVSRYGVTSRDGKEAATISIDADYARGSSGGPVLDDRGNVIGVVASTQSVYYRQNEGRDEKLQMVFKDCVPAERIMALISK